MSLSRKFFSAAALVVCLLQNASVQAAEGTEQAPTSWLTWPGFLQTADINPRSPMCLSRYILEQAQPTANDALACATTMVCAQMREMHELDQDGYCKTMMAFMLTWGRDGSNEQSDAERKVDVTQLVSCIRDTVALIDSGNGRMPDEKLRMLATTTRSGSCHF